MTDLHRDDLIRMVGMTTADVEFRANGDSDHLGTLAGYAAVFDSPTEIDSWEGRFTEIMAPGAFARTLKHQRDRVRCLFNHGMDPSIGEKALGKPSVIEERDRGLYVEVPLDDTSYNRDLAASLRSGALDGMSIRFSVTKEDIDDSGDIPVRTVKAAKLFEFGPVTFPAYEATTAGIRGKPAYEMWRNGPNTMTVTATGYDITVSGEQPDKSELAPGTSVDDPPVEALVGNSYWDARLAAMRSTVNSGLRRIATDERTIDARREGIGG